jgi:hypothetical protein
MRKSDEAAAWVVYRVSVQEKTAGLSAVCEQREWDEMEQNRPGYHTLVRGHITNECEAELLARGTTGDAKVRPPRRS